MYRVTELLSMEINQEEPELYDIVFTIEHHEQSETEGEKDEVNTQKHT